MPDQRCTEVNRVGVRCHSTARSGDTRCPLHCAVDLREGGFPVPGTISVEDGGPP